MRDNRISLASVLNTTLQLHQVVKSASVESLVRLSVNAEKGMYDNIESIKKPKQWTK